LQKICDDYRAGTIRSAKKERRRPKDLALAFFQKGHRLSSKKLFSFNPALLWESHGRLTAAFAGFNALRRSEPNAPKQSGAFFRLKYTFCLKAPKIKTAFFLSFCAILIIIL
jgi:hypothetical protein